ncbi:hypothetical protein EVAR_25131_1 [Eumeta japonica]|uniref:Uncharacterized protein n=1 Tax=Eumeta variegata TaxID=151549 RepID=A0A4C1XLJ1_EUMVA|nr:hypothetical protein EVAR_25131_1 [Eumeta japonica]
MFAQAEARTPRTVQHPPPPHDAPRRHLVIYLQLTLDVVNDIQVAEGIMKTKVKYAYGRSHPARINHATNCVPTPAPQVAM